MNILRHARAAINTGVDKLDSDPAAVTAGSTILLVVVGLTAQGIGWQLAFTFIGGFFASMTVFLLLEPLRLGKIEKEVNKIRVEMQDLVAQAEANGYTKAIVDMHEAIYGGDKP